LTSVLSQGISQLIKDGSDVVTCAGDILEYYNIRYPISDMPKNGPELPGLSELEQRITQKLQQEPMEIDALSRLLGISAAEIGTTISLMQLKGLIFIENGKYFVK